MVQDEFFIINTAKLILTGNQEQPQAHSVAGIALST